VIVAQGMTCDNSKPQLLRVSDTCLCTVHCALCLSDARKVKVRPTVLFTSYLGADLGGCENCISKFRYTVQLNAEKPNLHTEHKMQK
jgi:hypothetical protein